MLPLNKLLVRSYRIIRNAVIDYRYGGLLGGAYLSPHLTSNSDYEGLSYIFENRIKASDVLVDIGCGTGRVINWWLSYAPHNRIIGLELDEELAKQTRQRLQNYKNVTIIAGDAVQHIPPDGTLFYLYNPFGREVMKAFKKRLISLFSERHEITVFYYNCKHVDIFENDPAWIVELTNVGPPSSMPFDQLAILKLKMKSKGG